jgi:hypothetical protein
MGDALDGGEFVADDVEIVAVSNEEFCDADVSWTRRTLDQGIDLGLDWSD